MEEDQEYSKEVVICKYCDRVIKGDEKIVGFSLICPYCDRPYA